MQCSTEVQVACEYSFPFIHLQDHKEEFSQKSSMSMILIKRRPQQLKFRVCFSTFFFLWCSFFPLSFIKFFMSFRYEWFRGGGEVSNSVPRRRRSHPHATHTQLSQAPDHLVQRWTQDSLEQSHVSPPLVWKRVRWGPMCGCLFLSEHESLYMSYWTTLSCRSTISLTSENSKKFNTAHRFSPIPPLMPWVKLTE